VFLIEEKLKKIGYIEGVVNVKQWHLWCLDKSYRIFTLNIEISEHADPDAIRVKIEKKLLNKYCENLTVHIQ
jgi:Co/Zn/Cd efflux system component